MKRLIAQNETGGTMKDASCPLPGSTDVSESAQIDRMLQAERIAIVGLSDDPSKASYAIGQYLLSVGKTVIPVNPNCETVFDLPCYKTLTDVPGKVDLVNVFRRPEFCAGVARQAGAIGAKGLWLQAGIYNAEAKEIARKAGLDYTEGRCIMVEHRHHR
jgi:predicted CoA-binding protein